MSAFGCIMMNKTSPCHHRIYILDGLRSRLILFGFDVQRDSSKDLILISFEFVSFESVWL